MSVLISGCSDNNEMMIEVTYDPALGTGGFDGRLLVMITKDTVTEPRFQINDSDQTGIIIGKGGSEVDKLREELESVRQALTRISR